MRGELSRTGRALLVAGTLCVSTGAVWFTAGADSGLAHAACGLLFGLGLTLNVGSWFCRARSSPEARGS